MTDRRMKHARHMEKAQKYAEQIEAAIKDAGQPLTRTEISEMTDLTSSTVFRHTTRLLKQKRLHVSQVGLFDDGSQRPALGLGPGDGSEPERVRVKSQRQSRAPITVSWLGAL